MDSLLCPGNFRRFGASSGHGSNTHDLFDDAIARHPVAMLSHAWMTKQAIYLYTPRFVALCLLSAASDTMAKTPNARIDPDTGKPYRMCRKCGESTPPHPMKHCTAYRRPVKQRVSPVPFQLALRVTLTYKYLQPGQIVETDTTSTVPPSPQMEPQVYAISRFSTCHCSLYTRTTQEIQAKRQLTRRRRLVLMTRKPQ
jgi:hypothetical protein